MIYLTNAMAYKCPQPTIHIRNFGSVSCGIIMDIIYITWVAPVSQNDWAYDSRR